MPAISCSAPGKVILCGEHAVVYQQPAIALPVFEGSTKCSIVAKPTAPHDETIIVAPNIALKCYLKCLVEKHPIQVAINLVLQKLNIDHLPVCEIRIQSTLPTAAGLGSSASTSVALIRALSTFLGHPFTDDEVNQLAFEIEKIHHGTPSGIDNTVITYAKALFYLKGQPSEFLLPGKQVTLVIADTGIKGSTSKAVSDVRQGFQENKEVFSALFNQIGQLVESAKKSFINGDLISLGKSLSENHQLLQNLGVSCNQLDTLVEEALSKGALGAKLSGGGQGGNMIALVNSDQAEPMASALLFKGAVNTLITHIPAKGQ
ncbi:MAG: mevalonate kinase [Chloroflexi bacterium HGW-Chloroflexi-4]|nr:MAG: mevalonate kinase [Chloroflexi bacterium HGW-Chloroflexi-4]